MNSSRLQLGRRLLLVFIVAISIVVCASRCVADSDPLPTLEETVAGLRYHGGFFDVYWDTNEGRVLLKVDRWGDQFLVVDALASGLGSNPVGLDRGQLGRERLCCWKRVGRRVFLEQKNTRFRAMGAPPAEQKAVEDSFAPATIWAGSVEAIDPQGEAVLVDVTDLLVSDRHSVKQKLKSTGQGSYTLQTDRSYVVPEGVKSFPNNVELESSLTFASEEAGSQVRAVAASGTAFTLRQRISLIRLPDDAYETRSYHPRVGSFSVSFADYASPLNRSMHRRLMTRHRLTADQPIVYYVDPAAPEPIRSALVEGASWWSEAFAAAGFPDGFQVKVAPPEMDPLDVRFNFIQWVHRQTRGWSYGASVVDPRTGEILKGHVSLGSLRVRQDRLLIDNLARQSESQSAGAMTCGMSAADVGLSAMLAPNDDGVSVLSEEVALARIRQLSAHEVGHTLGLAHNFAASTYGDRASVMDYPAPRIGIDNDNQLDFSDAYGIGVGAWDRFCIKTMYSEMDDQAETMQTWVDESAKTGLIYLSDADARPPSAADPRANLWDNGTDPVDALEQTLAVRQVGLSNFDESVLLPGETNSDLRRYFAPLYFHHRFQVEAAVKVIGGVEYAYALAGETSAEAVDVSPDKQRRAMKILLRTLEPDALVVRSETASKLVPTAESPSALVIEMSSGRSDPIFDPLSMAETAAGLTLSGMLNPERLGRLPLQQSRNPNHPGFALVLEPLEEHAAGLASMQEGVAERMVARRVMATIVKTAIATASNANARQDVRAALRFWLKRLEARVLVFDGVASESDIAEVDLLRDQIKRFLERPDIDDRSTPTLSPPPGSPIGQR